MVDKITRKGAQNRRSSLVAAAAAKEGLVAAAAAKEAWMCYLPSVCLFCSFIATSFCPVLYSSYKKAVLRIPLSWDILVTETDAHFQGKQLNITSLLGKT